MRRVWQASKTSERTIEMLRYLLPAAACVVAGVAAGCSAHAAGPIKVTDDMVTSSFSNSVHSQPGTAGTVITCHHDDVDADGYGLYRCNIATSDPATGTFNSPALIAVSHDGQNWAWNVQGE